MHSAIFLAIGLHRKGVEEVEKEPQLPFGQVLVLFVEAVRKIRKWLGDVQRAAISASLAPPAVPTSAATLSMASARVALAIGDIDMELDAAGMGVREGLRDKEKQYKEIISTITQTTKYPSHSPHHSRISELLGVVPRMCFRCCLATWLQRLVLSVWS